MLTNALAIVMSFNLCKNTYKLSIYLITNMLQKLIKISRWKTINTEKTKFTTTKLFCTKLLGIQ
jgi:hypothetical protein